jgi:hypothetical protein
MKVSELIAELQKAIAEHGDTDARILTYEGWSHIDRVCYRKDDVLLVPNALDD